MEWKLDPPHGDDIGSVIRASFAGMPQLEREMKLASIYRVMDSASRGMLHPGDDLGPVRREPPHIFELRWRFGRHLYRLYFAEAPEFPEHLIALHFHHKDVEGLTDAEITAAQDEAISTAQLRYQAGATRNWGL
jgi:hypothetical protein